MFEGRAETREETVSWRSLANVDKECFACGPDNPHGLQMRFESDGTRLRSKLTLEKQFRGWSNLIHGGVLSTILDETMSWTVICLTKKFMLTKGMQVNFIKPVRIGMTVTATGYIRERISERKIEVVAEITNEKGDLCASSSGEFALFSREQFLRMGIMPEEEIDAMLPSIF
jgi:uncharacterized protein (TIGR00369 family)